MLEMEINNRVKNKIKLQNMSIIQHEEGLKDEDDYYALNKSSKSPLKRDDLRLSNDKNKEKENKEKYYYNKRENNSKNKINNNKSKVYLGETGKLHEIENEHYYEQEHDKISYDGNDISEENFDKIMLEMEKIIGVKIELFNLGFISARRRYYKSI
jgi:hypothetical protein